MELRLSTSVFFSSFFGGLRLSPSNPVHTPSQLPARFLRPSLASSTPTLPTTSALEGVFERTVAGIPPTISSDSFGKVVGGGESGGEGGKGMLTGGELKWWNMEVGGE